MITFLSHSNNSMFFRDTSFLFFYSRGVRNLTKNVATHEELILETIDRRMVHQLNAWYIHIISGIAFTMRHQHPVHSITVVHTVVGDCF